MHILDLPQGQSPLPDAAAQLTPFRHDQDRDHDMTADDRKRDRPEEEEQPVKWVSPLCLQACGNHTDLDRRARAEPKKEDRARGKRLFGNILGTLQQFKKEDKSARTSEAVSCCLRLEAFGPSTHHTG